MTTTPINSRILHEAAEWLMRLLDAEFSDRDRQTWQRWREQSAEHQRAWDRAEAVAARFNGIPSTLGLSVLGQAPSQSGRRGALKALSLLLVAGPTAWLASEMPWEDWSADCRSGTGEQRRVVLADSSVVTLNTATSIDVAYSAHHRLVTLHDGEVLVEATRQDMPQERPLILRTRYGAVFTAGASFDVRLYRTRAQVAVLTGAVQIRPNHPQASPVRIEAGFQTSFTSDGAEQPTAASATEGLWSNGLLYADDMRLTDFLAELSRYRVGVIRCDPAVENMRISGSFQVRHTDEALLLLTRTFPLQINSVTPYWITVGPSAV